MAKYMTAYNWRKGKIDLRHIKGAVFEMAPIELHHKENGAADDTASFGIVLKGIFNEYVFAQVSISTLREVLMEVGYDLTKCEPKKVEILLENKN